MASTSVSASAAAAGDAQQRPAADPGAFASMATAMQQHRYHPYHPFPHGVVGAAPIPMSSAYASSYASLASVPQQQQQQQQQQVVMTMAPAMAATTNTDAAAATGALQCHPPSDRRSVGGQQIPFTVEFGTVLSTIGTAAAGGNIGRSCCQPDGPGGRF